MTTLYCQALIRFIALSDLEESLPKLNNGKKYTMYALAPESWVQLTKIHAILAVSSLLFVSCSYDSSR
jgi:hypothetical protein